MEIGYLYAIGAAVGWGLTYALDQKILLSISPFTLLFVNSIITAIIMLPFIFFTNESITNVFISNKTNWLLLLFTIVLATISNYLILSGIKSLNASSVSIIEIAYPFFVVLFSYFLFKSTPSIAFFIGGAFIFVGSIIIIKFA